MDLGEAFGELVGFGLDEAFVGAPASGGIALGQNEGEAVVGCGEVLLAAVCQVGRMAEQRPLTWL